jgi:GMP synthase (glutamine-hydrolysing)
VKHHNTGLVLPDGVSLLEPLRNLYKYEVREIGKALGLPESVFNRQPFPGPGLLIRVVGVPVTHELLELVRWADYLVRQIMQKHGDYDRASQIVTAFLALITSGVKGDIAHHAGSIGIRGLKTDDFMTGRGVYFSEPTVRECSSLLTKHSQVQRVWYDYTDKPPARTEFE